MARAQVPKPLTKGVAKVPVVMQMEALECGAASLAMILAYYGMWLPLEQVRADCGVSRDGAKASNVLKAARSYGLEAKGWRCDLPDLMNDTTFPCIIHWNFNHFVVLDGFRNNKAYLNDPARGTVVESMETFDKSFTGVCLVFEPGEKFVPTGSRRSLLSFARSRLAGAGQAVVFALVCATLGSLLGMANPAFNRVLMDYILSGTNPDWAAPFMAGLLAISALQVVVAWIQAFYTTRVNGKLALAGSTSYFWKVLQLPMEFFSQRMAGDILLRRQENESIAETFVTLLAPLVVKLALMVFYLVVMVSYSPLLAVVGCTAVAINIVLSRVTANARVNVSRVQMRDAGKLYAATIGGVEMIETIKSAGAEEGFFERWAGYQASVNTQDARLARLDGYRGVIPQFVSAAANAVVLTLGVWLVVQGQLTAGMVLAFQGLLEAFDAPAADLMASGQAFLEMRTQMERVEDVMNYPSDPAFRDDELEEGVEYGKLRGHIEVTGLSFGYSRLDEPLIKDFDLTVEEGQSIALVGGSGSGKSTLAKIIAGLYQPWTGEVRYDGKLITEINRQVFTCSVAVVDQDIVLFEDTIANNIRMWDSSIEDFEVIMAARDADMHTQIMARPEGYNHVLVENGKDFSGGQRQRLEIARVLAQDPTVIILDEATSALDAQTERQVVKAIEDRGITCIVVAHRLSTIRDCDQILVLDQGEVVQRGTHEELYAQPGLYHELVSNE